MARPHGSPYDEEERLYSPPSGTYDPEWVVRMAIERSPGLDWSLAYRLATAVWRHLWASPQLSPDDLAGYCGLDEVEATSAEVVTVVDCAIDFCEAFDVEPPPAELKPAEGRAA